MSEENHLLVFPLLPWQLNEKIASWLHPIEITTSFRFVNKSAAAHFSGSEYKTVRLSQPVPPHAFAARWLAPGAMRGLTLAQRRKLLCLTAVSGVVENLELALQAVGCALTYEVFKAAAAAGKLASCQWLREKGCPMFRAAEEEEEEEEVEEDSGGLVGAAAGGGHWHVCEWLLSLDVTWSSYGELEAGRGGHLPLMGWLQEQRPQDRVGDIDRRELFAAMVHGCDLATLQRLWEDWQVHRQSHVKKAHILAMAAGSPTPDWETKCRGYALSVNAVKTVASAGNVEAVEFLLEKVPAPREAALKARVTTAAAAGGHLAVLQLLSAKGWSVTARRAARAAVAAVKGGHKHVLIWLIERFGLPAVRPCVRLFNAAAQSGSVELLQQLREHGCPWNKSSYLAAAEGGCEAALEWLVEQGCPFPASGGPYSVAARNGDTLTAGCLRRLGCPLGDGGR
ncbi:hypothetical protein GPECTOR_61g870 [Gonium pectorale]|uniref:Uncharacterized protein n=1 Tax=Gonium pectorale TaxID=33097 RepID=A0A150G4Z0_GONPE|nr:hypothetical protein GPECTOR_61g870 [Gonium pectorale]|eukprot:KXZ44917.1 hypothetical protein GPECTOR_61g870 [Gonium pectorale]